MNPVDGYTWVEDAIWSEAGIEIEKRDILSGAPLRQCAVERDYRVVGGRLAQSCRRQQRALHHGLNLSSFESRQNLLNAEGHEINGHTGADVIDPSHNRDDLRLSFYHFVKPHQHAVGSIPGDAAVERRRSEKF
ncbi:MAG TPA: hypothetical protein VMF32_02025, partial [Xanthobacteraceae bacterium]|nr:hypothetical protein [Xanthobacteraceae bacterium]